MLRIRLEIADDGCLKAFYAEGHSELKNKGEDPLCAAFSCLVKTVLNLLSSKKEFAIEVEARHSGQAKLKILSYQPSQAEWLKGLSDFFLQGVADLKAAYPKNLKVILNNCEMEELNGP